MLLVEHNARGALRLVTRGYVLETGSAAVSGTSGELTAGPKVRHAYPRFGADPVLRGQKT